MSNPPQAGNEYEPTVPGFERPPSPVSSYNNVFYITEEEEKRGPPLVPPHLEKFVLNEVSTKDGVPSAPSPPNPVVLNHMYTDLYTRGRRFPLEAVAVASTQRLGSQYHTAVLYKPAPQR